MQLFAAVSKELLKRTSFLMVSAIFSYGETYFVETFAPGIIWQSLHKNAQTEHLRTTGPKKL
jgi:hypothetical protein